MNNLHIFYYFIISLIGFSYDVLAIPLNDLTQNEETLIDTSESKLLLNKVPQKGENSLVIKKNEGQGNSLLFQSINQGTSLQGLKEEAIFHKDKQINEGDETDFYLFEQAELDEQKPSLELYQSLSPLLTPEMKRDAKKAWVETAELREALDFSSKESDSKELILSKSTKEMTLIKGDALEKLSNKNLPPALYDNKKPDEIVVRELFDGIYDLIKNALLIIAGVLILGKLISIMVKKIIINSERKKKRKARRRRRKRRRTFARVNN